MVFQFASTNLVFEIGIVMWIFLGWQFTLAEFVGGIVLIALMWLGVRLFVTRRLEEEARAHAEAAQAGHQHVSTESGPKLLSLDAWSAVAHNFRGDVEMLWKEILAGFLIAGYVALLPMGFFNGLFITDQGGALQLIENVLVGPIVAALAFVCSVGNVPLAAVLWAGGISFSGVIAFIYADLIVIPIVLIYRKYYGGKVTALIVAIMFATMVAAALIVDGIFSALGLVPTHRPSIESISERAITWNYTTALNILFLFVAAGLVGADAAARREGSRLRHDRRPPEDAAPQRPRRRDRVLLQRALQEALRRRSGAARRRAGARACAPPLGDTAPRGRADRPCEVVPTEPEAELLVVAPKLRHRVRAPAVEPGRRRVGRGDLELRAARSRRERRRRRGGAQRRDAQSRRCSSRASF